MRDLRTRVRDRFIERPSTFTSVRPMSTQSEFLELLEGCRRRDTGATAEFVDRYLPHVRTAVRRRLSGNLRVRFDSHDFAQNVWLSFFRVAVDRIDVRDETALVAYLCQMARLRVAEEYRHQTTLKNDLNRAVSMDMGEEPTGREPTPSTAAINDEEWQLLIANLTDRERAMLAMLREGHTQADTAAALNLSEKTVQRLLRKLDVRHPAPGR